MLFFKMANCGREQQCSFLIWIVQAMFIIQIILMVSQPTFDVIVCNLLQVSLLSQSAMYGQV